MKFVDEFRDPARGSGLQKQIATLANRIMQRRQRPLQLMEFCGGHTHTIFRFGLAQLLPESVQLVHGPGCPVCVLPRGRIDDCIAIARRENVIFTTFGDAMRVPGAKQSLLQAKAQGADVRMVYSPLDALALAKQHPQHEVVFFALGFETTMPSTALTLLQAAEHNITNFSLFCNHITTVPTIKAILDSPDMQLDGFLAPGHVCMVVGEAPFEFVPQHYAKPLVITGFEPLDILQSLYMLLKQIDEQRCAVENQYRRVVAAHGNHPGLTAINQVYELREFFEWRGLGSIDHSGVRIKPEYAAFDAEHKFAVKHLHIADPDACQCGEVLKGVIRPKQCKVFGSQCNPQTPMGALMVSSEGACAAYYNYANRDNLIETQQLEPSL